MSRDDVVSWGDLFARAAVYEVDQERVEGTVRAIRDGG
jgi:hypothetical protein